MFGIGPLELGIVLDLYPEMIEAILTAVGCYREVDARIVEHPLGVVVLENNGLGTEQRLVKIDRFFEIGHRQVNMQTFHCLLRAKGLTGSSRPTGYR